MKVFYTILFFVTIQLSSYAQHTCSYINGMINGDSHRAGTTAQNIDVVYNRIYWRMNPDTLTSATTEPIIVGSVTIYFKTKQPNVAALSFDLIKSSYNNANLQVLYHGTSVAASFPSTGNQNVLNFTLPAPIATTGTLDSVTINYAGKAIPRNGEAYGAIKSGTHGSTAYYWTLAESYEDRNFFPCKADTEDKIDSMLITISTPPAFTGVTNGRQISDVTRGSNNREITYKLTYPIASYLVAFSVGRFNKYVRTPVNQSGTSVPITYYTRSTLTSANLTSVDVCRDQMSVFSQYFGDYPFKNDGYGLMEFGFSGGMEHQTISSMNGAIAQFGSINLNAHELAHQWFGDKVTFKTWNELWIAEGFAKYLEAFYAQKDASTSTSYSSNMSSIKSSALSAPNNAVYLPDVSTSNAIWGSSGNYEAMYMKGAMVISMLRAIGGDTKFYQACQNLLNHPNHAYKSANTTDVKNIFSAAYGRDLTEFFNDWIYGKGYPYYSVLWGHFGNRINIQLNQTGQTSGATVSHFSTPVKLRISNAVKDTTVVIFDDNGTASAVGSRAPTNTVSFILSFVPTTVTVDPENEIAIAGTPTVTFLQSLPLENISLTGEHKNGRNNLHIKADGGEAVAEIQLEKSLDGISFIKLLTLTGNSGAPQSIRYIFTDNSPYLPATYYRVKFIKHDGSVEYSSILKLTTGQFEKIKILGNPVGNELKFSLGATVNNASSVSISSVEGSLILKQRIQANNNVHSIDATRLQAGNYVLIVYNQQGQQIAVSPFIKK